MFARTPTEGPFAKTNEKSLAQLTSCDFRSKNDPESGKQGDVTSWAGSSSLLPPRGQRPQWRRGTGLRGSGPYRAGTHGKQPARAGKTQGGEEKHRGGLTNWREAPPLPQLEENEVWVIQAIGHCGINSTGFLLGTFLFIKGLRHHELSLEKIMTETAWGQDR